MKRAMKAVATLLIVCLLIGIPSVNASYFTDIYTSDIDRETFDAINYVSDNGWIVGTGSTTYSPNSVLTRAMFVAILYRISGSAEKYTNSFTDVPTTAYYYDAVGWAVHYGIVAGITETQFGPNNSLTREQIFAFLFRYTTDYLKQSYSITQSIGNQADYSNISSYARTSVAWAKTYHILQVSNTGYVYPKSTVTRADAALFLTRFSREVISFTDTDRFKFINSSGAFSSTYVWDDNTRDRMMSCIDNYYGTGTSSAKKNKESVLASLGQTWNGSCQGIAFCTYFDKIGKIDFNKNFGDAKNLQAVALPKTNEKVEGAINYYHFAQGLSDFDYLRYSASEGNLEAGIISLYNYINSNGATLCGYGRVGGGHMYIATRCTYSASASKYTLYLTDPNYTTEFTRTIDMSGDAPMITMNSAGEMAQMTSVGYYRPVDYNFLDYFDLDGAYNDMDYSKIVYKTSSYDPETDLYCAEENAFLTVSCVPFKLTNTEGEVLTYDGINFGGTIEVLDSKYIVTGDGCTGKMQLAVSKSESFVFENLSNEAVIFTVITDDYFGSVYGTNLNCISIDTQDSVVLVDGSDMEYVVMSETGVSEYNYIMISGQNTLPFCIDIDNDTILTNGISGTNAVQFFGSDLISSKRVVLDFTTNNLLNLSNAESDDVILFSDGNNNEISFVVSEGECNEK